METTVLRIALLSLFLMSSGYSQGQIKTRNSYYDKEGIVLKETFQVSTADTNLKNGWYKLYSPEGVLLEQSKYINGKKNGKIIQRKSNGTIYFAGNYDGKGNFTGLEFSWRDSLNLSRLTLDYAIAGQAELLTPGKLLSFIDSLKTRVDKNEPLKTKAVFEALYYDVSSKYQKLLMLPKESTEFKEKGDELIYSYITLDENFTEYAEDEKDIKRFLELTDTVFRQRYPGLFSDKMSSVAARAEQYNKTHPKKEEQYLFTRKIGTEVKLLLGKMERTLELDKQLIELNTYLLRSYKPLQYPVLLKNKIQPLLKEANERESQKVLETRLARMIILYDSLQLYKTKFPELHPLNQKIDTTWPLLNEKIRKKFQETWLSNTRDIQKLYNEYLDEESLDKKITTGTRLAADIDKLAASFAEISPINDKIEDYFGIIDTRYSKEQPYIYEAQVKPLLPLVAEYRKLEGFDDKIKAGKEMSEFIYALYLSIDSLNTRENKISSAFRDVRQNYELNYPGIYNRDLKQLAQKIDAFQKIPKYKEKLNVSAELLSSLEFYQKRFLIIEFQKKNMNDSLEIAVNLYKKTITPIYKFDIQQLKTKQKLYTLNDTLEDKISKGDFILKKTRNLILNYDSLTRTESYLELSLPLLEKSYKKRFKAIYRSQIETLDKEMRVIHDLGSFDERLPKAVKLSEKLRIFSTQLGKLDELVLRLQSAYSQFELIYKDDKPNKIILKKGKELYNYYETLFEKSDSYEKSADVANRIMSLLLKLGSYSNKENSYLKEKLSKAKTPMEIEAAL